LIKKQAMIDKLNALSESLDGEKNKYFAEMQELQT
jgi:hypothetical protein